MMDQLTQARTIQQEQDNRMMCLTLALKGREGWDTKEIIKVADSFYSYVVNSGNGDTDDGSVG